ncbi:hypothetical protein ONZ45_g13800 [Pleurotus djamor]|nr:hypothetical protein ONZ45_g13800 [Pleurotus djamor]
MWSDIKLSDFSREAWPSIKIQRSKFVPLSLDLRIPSHALPPESSAFWALVHQIIARKLSIHELSLTLDTPRILAHFFALATKNEQPLLHSLSIFNSSHSLGEKGLHLWRGLPNLKSLTLYNVQMFDLDTLPFLPRLVNFHATGPTYEHPMTVPWLARALSSMPAIETVYVRNLCNGGALAETLSVPITIPSLQKLYIVFQDSNLGASRIFDYLDIPASSISCLIEPSPLPMHMVTMAHAPLVASLFAHWIQTSQEAKPLELRLDYSFDVVLSIGSPQTNGWRKIALSYRQVPSNLRLTLFDLLPLDAFTTMSFIHTHPNSSTELTKLLPQLIALRQIIFGIYSANTIECLIKKPSDDSPPSAEPRTTRFI